MPVGRELIWQQLEPGQRSVGMPQSSESRGYGTYCGDPSSLPLWETSLINEEKGKNEELLVTYGLGLFLQRKFGNREEGPKLYWTSWPDKPLCYQSRNQADIEDSIKYSALYKMGLYFCLLTSTLSKELYLLVSLRVQNGRCLLPFLVCGLKLWVQDGNNSCVHFPVSGEKWRKILGLKLSLRCQGGTFPLTS